MVIGLTLRCVETPVAIVIEDGNPTVFETNEASPSAIADTIVVSVSDDNTARVFVLNSSDITT